MRRIYLVIRWILVAPAAVIGWYSAFLIGLLVIMGAEKLCPEELIISGQCTAKWYLLLYDAVLLIGAALMAVLTIVFAAIVAPNYKYIVSVIVFILGAIFSTLILISSAEWGPYIWAISFGLMTLFQVKKYVSSN